MNDRNEIVEVEAETRSSTTKAVLVLFDGREIWLPKSLVEVDPRVEVVRLPRWLAEDKRML